MIIIIIFNYYCTKWHYKKQAKAIKFDKDDKKVTAFSLYNVYTHVHNK